jgi:hypothetical protein
LQQGQIGVVILIISRFLSQYGVIIPEVWRIVKWSGGAILADYTLVFYAMVERFGVWQYPYGDWCKGAAGE